MFEKGDRVILREESESQFPRLAGRHGTVAAKARSGTACFAIRWDGQRSASYFHADHLERLTPASQPDAGPLGNPC